MLRRQRTTVVTNDERELRNGQTNYRYLKAIAQRNKSPAKDAPPVSHNGFLYRRNHTPRKKRFFIAAERRRGEINAYVV